MAKLQPEYPSIQDGAGVLNTGRMAGVASAPCPAPSWHMPPSSASLPMLHNFNIVFLLRLICMLSIHNGCHTQFTKPSPFHGFTLQMRQEISLNFITFYSGHILTICSSANPIFASFHVNLAMSYLFYCLSIWYWILVWHKARTQRVPCLSVSVSGDSRTRIRLILRGGEHVLVPGIGWLLKGWWGETSGLKIIMGHVPLAPGMDPKTLFSIWFNSQKYLVSLT